MEKKANTGSLDTHGTAGGFNADHGMANRHRELMETGSMAVLAKKLGALKSEEKTGKALIYGGQPPCEDELDFIDRLSNEAEIAVGELEAYESAIEARQAAASARQAAESQGEEGKSLAEAAREIEESIPEPVPYSQDMILYTHISRDRLRAYGCIFPAIGGGKSFTAEQLYTLVGESDIKYGVDEAIIGTILDSKAVFKIFVIAKGIEKKDGVDGQIIDKFSREQKINIEAGSDKLVDYKNLNWMQTIDKGQVICEIIPPQPPVTGIDVKGNEMPGTVGKAPKPPAGLNTAVSEDGLSLVAVTDGQVSFKAGAFRVDRLINIDKDVDNSVGNLDVKGSINIKGNVNEGFTITATENIVVRGIVEGAYLKAGGNIQIFHGMNGSLKGTLEAGGTVTSRYLENCTVTAGGVVKADSIINSTVVSNDKVSVLSGKGIIIASNITGFKGIDAKVIGNDSNRLSNLTVGTDPVLLEEMNTLKNEADELEKKLDENDKNIKYLEGMKSLDAKYQQLLSKLKLDSTLDRMKLAKRQQRIAAINELLTEVTAQITAIELYPPVNVTINKLKTNITNPERMCRIYKNGGEIVIGKK
ncbi:MAG: DUF342 domain-containing protein [Clostridiales bacterium]|nr:DUF342 domain-containing protein [Clostridiales bacterium]